MGSFFDNLKQKFVRLKENGDTNNTLLETHTNDSENIESTPNMLELPPSVDISNLQSLNDEAVNYYSQIIANGGIDKSSESYKAFKELLVILRTAEIRKKLLDQDKSALAANLKYYLDQALEKADDTGELQSKDDNILINRKMNLCKAIRVLNSKMKTNPLAKGYKLQVYNNQLQTPVPDFCSNTNQVKDTDKSLFREYSASDKVLTDKYIQYKLDGNSHRNKEVLVQHGGANKYYADALEKLAIAKDSKDDDLIKTVINDIENHPIYSPKFEEVKMSDRLMMILLSFIIRNISLFLINWGIDSSFITNFKQGLIYYIGLYTLIFLLVVAVVNNSYTDNISIKLLFYYINVETQGYLRIVAHLLILYSLIPIIFILKEKNSNTSNFVMLSYQDKIKIKNAVNIFTLSSWILTSIIILRF